MNEKEIREAKELLSSKRNGQLRTMFYKKNGLPKQGLYTNRQILEKLGFDGYHINTLEHEGILRLLGVAIAQLRKQAKDAGLAWLDVEIISDGSRVARHGYNTDIDLILLNADKFDSIADSRVGIASDTREIADLHLRMVRSNKAS